MVEAAAAAAAPLLHGLPDDRSSSALTPNPSCAAAPSAVIGAAPPPPGASSSPTMPDNPPSPIFSRDRRTNFVHILTVDHRPAMFHTVARLDEPFSLETSCDGLLLSRTCRPYGSPSGTLHTLHDDTEIVNIWVLQDYESEVWDFKYRIKLPLAEIREQFEDDDESWFLDTVSVDSGALLLINFGGWLLQVDSDGKLIHSFGCGHRDLCRYGYRLKQSLVQHTFFPALKSSALSASPLI